MPFLKDTELQFDFDEGDSRVKPAEHEIWLSFGSDYGAYAFNDWIQSVEALDAFKKFYEANEEYYS